jgi:hypothetical protein
MHRQPADHVIQKCLPRLVGTIIGEERHSDVNIGKMKITSPPAQVLQLDAISGDLSRDLVRHQQECPSPPAPRSSDRHRPDPQPPNDSFQMQIAGGAGTAWNPAPSVCTATTVSMTTITVVICMMRSALRLDS